MPIDEDSNGCHDVAPAAASAPVVLPPSMTKSVSYMSSTSSSSYSTSNTGECDVSGQTAATSAGASGCLSRGDVRAPVREVHRVTFAEDRNKYLNADDLCDGLDFELELRLAGRRASDDDDAELIPRHSIIKLPRPPSPENHENPFIADGELRRKADYIIQNSTISRRRIRIADPDCTPPPQPPQPSPPPPADSQRDGARSPAADEVELIEDAVSQPPTLTERSSGDLAWSPLIGATVPEDRQRQRTPSPVVAMSAGDVDPDGKAETSTAESDRPTASLLRGATCGDSGHDPSDRRRCCAIQ